MVEGKGDLSGDMQPMNEQALWLVIDRPLGEEPVTDAYGNYLAFPKRAEAEQWAKDNLQVPVLRTLARGPCS
jgi:hypothetical protein